MGRTDSPIPIRFIHTLGTDQLHSLFGPVIHMWIIFCPASFLFASLFCRIFLMICNFPGLNWLCYRRSLKFNVFALMFRFTSFCERCSINNELVYKYTYRCRKMSFVPKIASKRSAALRLCYDQYGRIRTACKWESVASTQELIIL